MRGRTEDAERVEPRDSVRGVGELGDVLVLEDVAEVVEVRVRDRLCVAGVTGESCSLGVESRALS